MSEIKKRSITIAGHRTSVSLEGPFWDALAGIAKEQNVSLAALVAELDADRVKSGVTSGLSSALRVYILRYYSEGAGAGAATSTKSSQTGRVSKSKTR